MKSVSLIVVLGALLAACSSDTSALVSMRDGKKALFTAMPSAGGGGAAGADGVLELGHAGAAGGLSLAGGEAPVPTGVPTADDGGAPEADSGGPVLPPDGGQGAAGRGAQGVPVCGHCDAATPCAPGLVCFDERLPPLGRQSSTQPLTSRCYIDCATVDGQDACTALGQGACAPLPASFGVSAQSLCPLTKLGPGLLVACTD